MTATIAPTWTAEPDGGDVERAAGEHGHVVVAAALRRAQRRG